MAERCPSVRQHTRSSGCGAFTDLLLCRSLIWAVTSDHGGSLPHLNSAARFFKGTGEHCSRDTNNPVAELGSGDATAEIRFTFGVNAP